jgi:hypothetical protein
MNSTEANQTLMPSICEVNRGADVRANRDATTARITTSETQELSMRNQPTSAKESSITLPTFEIV